MPTLLDIQYNNIVERIKSSKFRDPIKDFMDDNCNYFLDIDENTPEIYYCFDEFKKLIDSLGKKCCDEFNLTEEQFNSIIERGLKDPESNMYFEQLLSFKNFDYFKRLMIDRHYKIIQIIENEMYKKKIFKSKNEVEDDLIKAIEESKKTYMDEEDKKKRIEVLNKRELERGKKKSIMFKDEKKQKKLPSKNDSNNESNNAKPNNSVNQSGNKPSIKKPQLNKPKINELNGLPEIKKKLPSLNPIDKSKLNPKSEDKNPNPNQINAYPNKKSDLNSNNPTQINSKNTINKNQDPSSLRLNIKKPSLKKEESNKNNNDESLIKSSKQNEIPNPQSQIKNSSLSITQLLNDDDKEDSKVVESNIGKSKISCVNLFEESNINQSGFDKSQLNKNISQQSNNNKNNISNSGFPESQINNSGFPQSQIKNSGFPQSQIKNNEFPESQINNIGFTQSQIKNSQGESNEIYNPNKNQNSNPVKVNIKKNLSNIIESQAENSINDLIQSSNQNEIEPSFIKDSILHKKNMNSSEYLNSEQNELKQTHYINKNGNKEPEFLNQNLKKSSIIYDNNNYNGDYIPESEYYNPNEFYLSNNINKSKFPKIQTGSSIINKQKSIKKNENNMKNQNEINQNNNNIEDNNEVKISIKKNKITIKKKNDKKETSQLGDLLQNKNSFNKNSKNINEGNKEEFDDNDSIIQKQINLIKKKPKNKHFQGSINDFKKNNYDQDEESLNGTLLNKSQLDIDQSQYTITRKNTINQNIINIDESDDDVY